MIQGFNYSLRAVNSSFNYYFHTAETNWPDDMLPAKFGDDNSALKNIYDALVFKTHRIGHGLGYFKHPELYPLLKQLHVTFEVCPASNQILGFVPDLRNHPAINYYKSGIPIVIAGDDPGSFGYNDLTVDYYLVFMSWGLNLYDLREIANNSVRYSSITDPVKENGLKKFTSAWLSFIDTIYDYVCDNLEMNFDKIRTTHVYPYYGPNDGSNTITIYGYGFENFMCEAITCYFDGMPANGYLKELDELVCQTPKWPRVDSAVNLSISSGNKTLVTQLSYKFVSPLAIKIF